MNWEDIIVVCEMEGGVSVLEEFERVRSRVLAARER